MSDVYYPLIGRSGMHQKTVRLRSSEQRNDLARDGQQRPHHRGGSET